MKKMNLYMDLQHCLVRFTFSYRLRLLNWDETYWDLNNNNNNNNNDDDDLLHDSFCVQDQPDWQSFQLDLVLVNF